MAANWLLELGIPFDPTPSADEVAKLLDEREREFSMKANKGERGSYYSVMLERLGSIRAELSDAQKLAAYADEAKRLSYPVIDQLVDQALSADGAQVDAARIEEVTEFAQDLIASRANMANVMLPEGLVEKRLKAGATVNSDGADASQEAVDLYQKLVQQKPVGRHKYRSFEADLQIFGVDNLYDYVLGVGAAWDEMRQAALDDLLARAEAKVGDYQKGTSERSASERLRSRAREVCASAEEWSRYCDYLVWRDTKESLDMMGRLARLGSGEVPQDSYERVVEKITALQGDATVAQLIVRGYCESQDPPLTLPKPPKKDKPGDTDGLRAHMPSIEADSSGLNLVTCPHCGKRTRSGGFCMECGGSLSTSQTAIHPAMAQQAAAQPGATGMQSMPRMAGMPGAAGAGMPAGNVQQQVYQTPQQQYQPMQQTPQQVMQSWSVQQQQPAQTYTQPPAQTQGNKSKVPVIVAAVLVVVALALVLFVVFDGPKKLSGDSGSSGQSQQADTVQVDAGAQVDCSSATRIIPRVEDTTSMERYRVALAQRSGEGGSYDDQLMELNVEGEGGFGMSDFAKYGATLSSQVYQLTITDSDTSREYTLFVDFSGVNSSAPKTVELICK